jgi:hypothetical protein
MPIAFGLHNQRVILYHSCRIIANMVGAQRESLPLPIQIPELRVHVLVCGCHKGTWSFAQVNGAASLPAKSHCICKRLDWQVVNGGFYTTWRLMRPFQCRATPFILQIREEVVSLQRLPHFGPGDGGHFDALLTQSPDHELGAICPSGKSIPSPAQTATITLYGQIRLLSASLVNNMFLRILQDTLIEGWNSSCTLLLCFR